MIIYLNYVEGGNLKNVMAELRELNGEVKEMRREVDHHLMGGIEGERYSSVYHHVNGTTIIVDQTETIRVASWREKKENVSIGWKPRRFSFGGEESKIKEIRAQLEAKGVELILEK